MRAFWDLHTERTFGMSLGPIPYSRIKTYGEDQQLEDDVLTMFIDTIRAMGIAYLVDNDEEQKRKSPPRAPRTADEKPTIRRG